MRKRGEKPKLTRLEKLTYLNLLLIGLVGTSNRLWAETTSITTYVAYIPQAVWVLPTLILLPFCLFAKPKKRALIHWGVAAIVGLITMGFSIPSPFNEIEGREFTLMTFNIRHAEKGWEGVREVILEKKPDIVCFQEADDKTHFRSAIGNLPGYFVERRNGLAIASKKRLTDVREVPLSPGTSGALEAKIGEVKVVNLQLASFKRLTSPGHFKDMADIHYAQMTTLIQRYAKELDCVIAGDFNNPPVGRNYRYMRRRFNDAYKGWGFGYTYPSSFPLLRIDHAFTTDLQPLSAEVVATTVSDHRPVLFKLLLYRPT